MSVLTFAAKRGIDRYRIQMVQIVAHHLQGHDNEYFGQGHLCEAAFRNFWRVFGATKPRSETNSRVTVISAPSFTSSSGSRSLTARTSLGVNLRALSAVAWAATQYRQWFSTEAVRNINCRSVAVNEDF
jgi:hypothetical protein